MGFWKKNYTDEEIAGMIQSSPGEREKALKYIYTNGSLRYKVRSVALSDSGSSQDADDLWHDTFIVTEKKIGAGEFRSATAPNRSERSALSSFMVGIARGLWANRKRKMRPEPGLEPVMHHPSDENVEKWLLRKEGSLLLNDLITNMMEKCRALLGLYNLYFSMREIRDALVLPSEKRANKDMDICRKKLRLYLEQHPELMDALDPYL
ncbi:MAG: hypothetical protein DYG98_13975 [Haliscomenobacteraceae bacterium CHB4]|nr:hypothetical protein [Saprospiraceae bacterium]MCE7924156.1 hypothetical protein [Haliscomenobacteraceae bacterium CHB4]